MTMSTTEIEEERRRGRLAGASAAGAGVLLAAGIAWSAIANRDRPDRGDAERLRFFDEHAGELIGISVLRALGFLLLIAAIIHLQRATKARNPELPPVPLIVGVFGAIALAVGSLGQAIFLASEAADFADKSFPTERAAEQAADDVSGKTLPIVTSVIAFAGSLGLAFWFVLGSLNAMRVGLLTRFMGVLGIIVGPGFLFGFALPVMVFWLIAVGLLFMGIAPRGMPPAWDAGEAVPWPGREQPLEQPEEPEPEPGSPNGEVDAVGPGVRTPDSPEKPRQKRRKRKRRG
jgi:hypothetical protein